MHSELNLPNSTFCGCIVLNCITLRAVPFSKNHMHSLLTKCHLIVILPFPSALDTKASNLSTMSKKYRSDAKYLNTRSTYAKVAAVAVFFITLIVYARFWWLWQIQQGRSCCVSVTYQGALNGSIQSYLLDEDRNASYVLSFERTGVYDINWAINRRWDFSTKTNASWWVHVPVFTGILRAGCR